MITVKEAMVIEHELRELGSGLCAAKKHSGWVSIIRIRKVLRKVLVPISRNSTILVTKTFKKRKI